MTDLIDLKALSIRESEQVEWKENVADPGDVVATLAAFANDWSNLGGGYVVCGVREEKDEHGFPRLAVTGLAAAHLKEVEGRVMAACRDNVSPPIVPTVHEISTEDPTRRVLVFVMPATRRAHSFRRKGEAGRYYIRLSRETREARNGLFLQLMVRKSEVEAWDHRPCPTATVNDLDLLAFRDLLQRIDMAGADRDIEALLSDDRSIHALLPPFCVREPLTGILRPRNFAMLLFGRNLQRFIPGAHALFSVYPGTDRAERHAVRHEILGTLVQQAARLVELLDARPGPSSTKRPARSRMP